jgi:SulP family sulfate permease
MSDTQAEQESVRDGVTVELATQLSAKGLEGNDDGKGGKVGRPEDDPFFYNTWRKILSRPMIKPKWQALLRELLSGLTVSLAQVPEAVAFAFTAGVPPLVGLQAAWIVGLIDAVGGGAPGMVSGATGALAVVLPQFVEDNGIGFLFIAVLLMGIIQLIFAAVGGAKLVKLIGHPVMIGFCNGLAIVIFAAQFHSFKYLYFCQGSCSGDPSASSTCVETTEAPNKTFVKCPVWITGATAGWQALEVLATMAIIFLLPKCTKAFPPSLAGIVLGTVIEHAIVRTTGYRTPTVKDMGSLEGSFPVPIWLDSQYTNQIPPLDQLSTYTTALPISATLAVIGLVESLMTLQLVGEITEKKPNPHRESFAQGIANVVTGIFGGMGGCAMIGQSMINVKSGGVTRISTSFAASFLLVIILAAYPLINLIPVASLAGGKCVCSLPVHSDLS